MPTFTVFPAIDLRQGQVVRLKQGDPGRQTIYAPSPAEAALQWLEAGARWIHVVNLDGAFGEPDGANRHALSKILRDASGYAAKIQLGGGLRTERDIRLAFDSGAARVILGTVAIEQPELLDQALREYGPEKVAAALDARDGLVRTRGWVGSTGVPAVELAGRLAGLGVRWLIFTDIARDGIGSGLNLPATLQLARLGSLSVIASGGVNSLEDIQKARASGLAGVIVGRALYEGKLDIRDWSY